MKSFAVIGLGRFGYKLAIALSMSGAEVIAIDRDRTVIDQIRDQVANAVRLDSTDEDAIRAQGVDKVDVAVIGMGQGGRAFESAIMTVVSLKNMGIKNIYARAQSLTAGQVFSAVGATDIIYPEIETAQRWAYKLIAPHVEEKIDFALGLSLARITAPASFHDKTVVDLQLRQKYNVNLVAIKHAESDEEIKTAKGLINVPTPETVIYSGDTLMLVGSEEDLARLPQQ
ncbi:MAG: TrkA family potassium uptake protein [Sedimentisphaerales bacterium]|nr:TrkA family potassium uptake protein [Sedimentisphaerales bacterium]